MTPFHLLAKPTGAVCNLDCDYCFFLSKEMLYPGSRFRMTDEVLEAYLRQLVEAHAGAPEVTIAWQGGEPTLMGLDFFRRSVEIARRHLQPGQRALHTIQTNGTLLDAEWAAFFKEQEFLVGVSIDGPRDVHDTYRVTKGGRGSFEKVVRGLGHLRDAGVEWNALTTIHAANAQRGREVYRFLRDACDARFLQLIPIIERVAEAEEDGTVPWSSWRDRPLYVQEGDVVTGRSVTGEQYGRFLIDVFEEWVRRDVGEVYVQMFDVALANWAGEPPGLCVHSETCGRALALEHTGDLYSCDHFVEPEHLLGNIGERPLAEMVASPEQERFGRDKRDTLPAVLPRLRRAVRLPRRLPQGPLHLDAERRARAQLPVRRLPGVLPPRRRADARDDRPLARGPRPGRDRRALRRGGPAPGAQRPVPVRQRPQVEALPRRGGGVGRRHRRRAAAASAGFVHPASVGLTVVPGATISSIRSSSASVELRLRGAELGLELLHRARADDRRRHGRMADDEGERHVDQRDARLVRQPRERVGGLELAPGWPGSRGRSAGGSAPSDATSGRRRPCASGPRASRPRAGSRG